MAKRVLLCWEFGQGTTHARILKTIGDELSRQGCTVVYALCAPSFGEEAGIAKGDIRQGPGWPLKTVPGYGAHRLTSASYGDIFAQMFLDVDGELDERLRQWRLILDQEQPDLVIADYAPGLSLAAHGRLPLIALGNGYTLPPVELETFPVIGGQAMKYREEEAVERINQALLRHALKPIAKFPEINRADRHCLLTYPIFDPYRADRKSPWLGSPVIPAIRRNEKRGAALFAYFYEQRQLDKRLLDGLVGGGLPGNAVFTTPIRQTAKALAKAGIEAPFGLLDFAEEFPKVRVLVHQGGLNTCCAGALAGIPQVIVYTDQEKKLYAQPLAQRGAGFMLEWSEFTAGGLTAAIREAAQDDMVLRDARKIADEVAPFARQAPVEHVVSAALALTA
jgi:rhamnosyltransferase subunit B